MPLWTSNGSGSWLTASRWSGSTIPNAAGAVAEFTVNTEEFGIYQISIPSDTTVTIGTLNIVSSSLDGYSILSANGATNAFLRFQGVGGSPAFINVDSNGSDESNIRNTPGMGVVFASDVILTTINSDTFFEISAPISGSGDLNKYGTGTLSLTGNNSGWLGDVNLLGGRTLANGSALGTGNVELNNGAVLVSSFTVANRIEIGATAAVGTIVAGAGQVLTLSGELVMASNSANAVRFGEMGVIGTVVLTGTSTILGTGGFAAVDGILQFGNAGVAANYFSNLAPLATFSVIGIVETRGFAALIDNLDMDGGVLRAGTGALDVTVIDTTNGGNSQTGTIEGSVEVDRIVFNVATNFSLGGADFVTWSANDTITINGNGNSNQLTGSSQSDVLNGGGGADTLIGGAGNDQLTGGNDGVADALHGGLGDDQFVVNGQEDAVAEAVGQGADTVFASASYTLSGSEIEVLRTTSQGGTAAINLTGNGFSQSIFGNNGGNVLNGGSAGDDILAGFAGNDSYVVNSQSDQVIEAVGQGSDTVFTSVSYGLALTAEIEFLRTSAQGSTTALNLVGSNTAQTVIGNAGDNTIDGRGGNDTMHGLGGADSFAFRTALGAGNVDRIADYSVADDRILLDDAVFAGLALGTLAVGAFNTGAAASQADDRIIYNGATGALLFDADGSGAGAAIQFATLSTGLAMTAAEFVVI